jgi:hypothetical protein
MLDQGMTFNTENIHSGITFPETVCSVLKESFDGSWERCANGACYDQQEKLISGGHFISTDHERVTPNKHGDAIKGVWGRG